eukprot:scaffold1328_cov59-Phaeocystis_antarctica.AAC.4
MLRLRLRLRLSPIVWVPSPIMLQSVRKVGNARAEPTSAGVHCSLPQSTAPQVEPCAALRSLSSLVCGALALRACAPFRPAACLWRRAEGREVDCSAASASGLAVSATLSASISVASRSACGATVRGTAHPGLVRERCTYRGTAAALCLRHARFAGG